MAAMERSSGNPGTLWIVATPIGNLDDMAPRARQTLQSVDLVAAEDTRHTGRLLAHFDIDAKLVSLHEHNEQRRIPDLIARLESGDGIALVSDAGTPLISDPGYRLVRAARDAGVAVSTVPGPCAAIAALSVAGLPTDRFRFEGFLPARAGPRSRRLEALRHAPETLVFYETARRITIVLGNMESVFGAEREVALCRELTKLHETTLAGAISSVRGRLESDAGQLRGEMVLVVAGAPDGEGLPRKRAEGERLFELLRGELPAGTAAKLAAAWSGCRRRDLYR